MAGIVAGRLLTVHSFLGHIEVPGNHSDSNVFIVGRNLRPILGEKLQEVIMKHDVIPAVKKRNFTLPKAKNTMYSPLKAHLSNHIHCHPDKSHIQCPDGSTYLQTSHHR